MGCVGEIPYMARLHCTVFTHFSKEAVYMQKRVQGCHKTINAWLKSFKILMIFIDMTQQNVDMLLGLVLC